MTIEDRESLAGVWARADTIAFVAWIPIVRALKEKDWDCIYRRDFGIALHLATLSYDLKSLWRSECQENSHVLQ